MVILAQYYQFMLFLDYRDKNAVRCGLVDFDEDDWPNKIMSRDSFDAFFADLRHYKSL